MFSREKKTKKDEKKIQKIRKKIKNEETKREI